MGVELTIALAGGCFLLAIGITFALIKYGKASAESEIYEETAKTTKKQADIVAKNLNDPMPDNRHRFFDELQNKSPGDD